MTEAKQKNIRSEITRWLFYTAVTIPTLLLVLNSYNSGIAKTSSFFLFSLLILTYWLWFFLQKKEVPLCKSPLDIPVLLFFLAVLLSLSLLPRWNNTANTAMLWMSCSITFLVSTQLFQNEKSYRQFLNLLLVLGFIVGTFGAIQYLLRQNQFVEFYLGDGKRIGSTIGNAAHLGGFLVLIIPLIFARGLYENRSKWRILCFVCAILLLSILIATQSRSSIIAFAVSSTFFAFMIRGKKTKGSMRALFAFTGLFVVLLVLFPGLVGRFGSLLDSNTPSTISRRFFFWDAGWKALLSSPVYGNGIGSYETVMLDFRTADYWMARSEDIVPHAHNELLEVGVELGLLGIILYHLPFVLAVRLGIKATLHAEGKKKYVIAGFVTGLIAIFVDNLANVSLRIAPVAAIAWICIGFIASPFVTGSQTITVKSRMPAWTSLAPVVVYFLLAFFLVNQTILTIQSSIALMSGIQQRAAGQYHKAISSLRASLEHDRTNLTARENLSVAFLNTAQMDEALRSVEILQSVSRHYPKSSLMKSLALLSLGEFQEAANSIRDEISRRDHPEAYYVQSMIWQKMGKTEEELLAVGMVVRRNIAAGTEYNIEQTCERLVELSRTPTQRSESRELLQQVAATFPDNRLIPLLLVRIDSVQ